MKLALVIVIPSFIFDTTKNLALSSL